MNAKDIRKDDKFIVAPGRSVLTARRGMAHGGGVISLEDITGENPEETLAGFVKRGRVSLDEKNREGIIAREAAVKDAAKKAADKKAADSNKEAEALAAAQKVLEEKKTALTAAEDAAKSADEAGKEAADQAVETAKSEVTEAEIAVEAAEKAVKKADKKTGANAGAKK